MSLLLLAIHWDFVHKIVILFFPMLKTMKASVVKNSPKDFVWHLLEKVALVVKAAANNYTKKSVTEKKRQL